MQAAIDFSVTPAMSDAERETWYVLRHREGSARAIKAEDLAELARLSVRNVQRAVHALIHEHGKAIGSSMAEPFGYYLAVTPEERDEASKLHRRRALAMLSTAAKIAGISRREYVERHQLELIDAA